MLSKVKIGERSIGEGEPVFIIAEAGSNHNGDFEQALRLIDVAAKAKVDAVKFQLFRARTLYPKSAGQCDYLKIPQSIYDIISRMEMPYEWLPKLADHCRQHGVMFLSSVLDEEGVERLDPYVPAFKIPSYELTHLPLIQAAARRGKPVIVSTGVATLEEVVEMATAFRETDNEQLIVMQCTGTYPAPFESLNIRAMATLREALQVPIGYSDHSRDPLVAPLAATAAGAHLLEKHFTLGNTLPGPDHRFALEPAELRLMVQKVRETEQALGHAEKSVHQAELELRQFARRSIFALRRIEKGECFSKENVAVLRCGALAPGLAPKEYPRVLGRRALRAIEAETTVQLADIGAEEQVYAEGPLRH